MCEKKTAAKIKSKGGRPRELNAPKNYCVALGSNHQKMVVQFMRQKKLRSESSAIREMIELAAGKS